MDARSTSVPLPRDFAALYKQARNRLLQAELRLRKDLEEVAVMRRALPLGEELSTDYVFEENGPFLGDSQTARNIRMSDLFEMGKDTLAIYSALHGSTRTPCLLCCSILDSLNEAAPYAAEQVNIVVASDSPPDEIGAFVRERRWQNLRLISCLNNPYNADYQCRDVDGKTIPSLNIFVRRSSRIHHFYGSEIRLMPPAPGQAPRLTDLMWHLWNLFEFTPDGHRTDWYPEQTYAGSQAPEMKCA